MPASILYVRVLPSLLKKEKTQKCLKETFACQNSLKHNMIESFSISLKLQDCLLILMSNYMSIIFDNCPFRKDCMKDKRRLPNKHGILNKMRHFRRCKNSQRRYFKKSNNCTRQLVLNVMFYIQLIKQLVCYSQVSLLPVFYKQVIFLH